MSGTPPAAGKWLAAVAFVALIVAVPFVPSAPAPLMRGVSSALFAVGAVFGGLAYLELRRSAADSPEAGTVVRRGPYAVVRHPQYLGLDFLAWGVATFALYWGTILPAIAVTLGCSIQARAEEEVLLERCGEAYQTYRQSVPRFGLFTGLVRLARGRRRRSPE